jgi:hypothetical protein
VALLGVQDSVSAHFLETSWKHVLQEPSDKLRGGQRAGTRGVGFGVAVAESDLAVFETEDVSIADGHAEDIRGEVLQSMLSGTDGDYIHDPVLPPSLWIDLIEKGYFFEQVTELGPEDFGKGLFGQQVFAPSGQPSICGQSAAGDEIVHMGVVAKVTGPGLQDSDHAEGASYVFGIGSELLQGMV